MSIESVKNIKSFLDANPLAAPMKSCTNFKSYTNGIFSDRVCSSTDHAVLIVGYDSTSWKIKNSWGTTWGDKGFGNVLIASDTGTYKDVAPKFADGGYLSLTKGPLYYTTFGNGVTKDSILLDTTITSICPASIWLPSTRVVARIEFGKTGSQALGMTVEPSTCKLQTLTVTGEF